MGIKFRCPNGHKLNVKSFLAGKNGICPHCGIKVKIPGGAESAADHHDGDLELGGGGTATALLTKSMADTVSLPTTFSLPTTATAAPVNVTPVVSANPVSVATVNAAPMITPIGVASPAAVTPVPVATVTPVVTSVAVAASIPAGGMAIVTPVGAPVVSAAIAAPLSPSPYAVMPAATVDAIAEAPNAVWYVRPPQPVGGQFGPARGDVMRKWLGEGRVSADSLVWRDGWSDWKPAAQVFPSLAPAGAPSSGLPTEALAITNKIPASRVLRAKKRSNGFAMGLVITLGMLAVVLLIVFIVVLSRMNAG